ncbi:sulfur oxidation c-type cytochrome SoxX [Hyphomicrobium sp. 1Nfss2.1]|uniref:sulfur oxidation c-type cytochrome SoxX n=1 Tax=Hyphomicrobium sp. 1Nfss2.1 TaxID=3413936 RepID=UPI003C7AAA24
MKLAGLRFAVAGAVLICTSAMSVNAEDAANSPAISSAELDTYVKGMWPHVEPGWESRLTQDETQAQCSRVRNNPSPDEAQKITERETATIRYPSDGNVLGYWREGEKIASSGKGGQFSDAPDTQHGGNCYACHQLAPGEVAFGTLGPSLTGYGKLHEFSADAARAAYAKLFNAQASVACSNMPRFGAHGFLTEQQLKDVNAYLFDRESPVNK